MLMGAAAAGHIGIFHPLCLPSNSTAKTTGYAGYTFAPCRTARPGRRGSLGAIALEAGSCLLGQLGVLFVPFGLFLLQFLLYQRLIPILSKGLLGLFQRSVLVDDYPNILPFLEALLAKLGRPHLLQESPRRIQLLLDVSNNLGGNFRFLGSCRRRQIFRLPGEDELSECYVARVVVGTRTSAAENIILGQRFDHVAYACEVLPAAGTATALLLPSFLGSMVWYGMVF